MNNISKIILSTIATVILFYTFLLLLPKSQITYLKEDALREYALTHNLAPVPKDYKTLLKIVDNPKNPMTPRKIALGKKLFFDPILSLDKTIACASCHLLKEGGDDNLPTAIGYHDRANPKHLNSPTVLNAALATREFWDGRVTDVEAQAAGPMQATFEMNITPKEAVKRISEDAYYVEEFAKVFDGNISFLNIQNAIGAYERTLLTRGDYDRFLEGNNEAITASAKRGLNLFIQRGCKGCHTGMSLGGQSMQLFPLRRALMDIFKTEPFPFPNVGGFLGENDKKRFRVPILRNITQTGPYFHNGAVKELEEAVRIMSKYQVGREFTPMEIKDMIEFFKTLKGELVPYDINLSSGGDFEGFNLTGMDLSHKDLHGINLTNANLTNSTLFASNLSAANLTNAIVKGADFTAADLSFSSLSLIDFQGVDLIEVKLESANFFNAIWRDGRPCLKGSIGKCNQ